MLTKDYCSRILFSSDAHLFLPCSLVICVALTTKIYGRNSSLHCTWGFDEERIWWKGGFLFFLIMDLDYEQCGCSQPHLDRPWKLLDYESKFQCRSCLFINIKYRAWKLSDGPNVADCVQWRGCDCTQHKSLLIHCLKFLPFFCYLNEEGPFCMQFFCFYLLTIFSLKAIDCRCLVLWSHLICDVSRRLSFWRPCGSKGL